MTSFFTSAAHQIPDCGILNPIGCYKWEEPLKNLISLISCFGGNDIAAHFKGIMKDTPSPQMQFIVND